MISIFFASLLFLSSFAGGILPLFYIKKNKIHAHLTVSLGAGLLLGMSVLHIMPEALNLIPSKTFAIWFLCGFSLLLFLERFIMVHSCEEDEDCEVHKVGLSAFLGLAIHGLIEGIALGTSFYLQTQFAFLLFLAIFVHKIPSSMALTSILAMKKTRSPKEIILFLFGVSCSMPLGIGLAYLIPHINHFIVGHFFSSHLSVPGAIHGPFDSLNFIMGPLLSLSAGTFLYIATCDLIPHLHEPMKEKWSSLGMFFLGILLSFLPH